MAKNSIAHLAKNRDIIISSFSGSSFIWIIKLPFPFDITLDPRYDISTVKADIDDFYYDVINSDTLSVNIDLFIEAEYLPEDVQNTDIYYK